MAASLGQRQAPTGLATAGGSVAVVAVAVVAAAVPPSAAAVRLGLVAVTVGLFAAVAVDPLSVAVVSGLAFLISNGFLVNRLGVLSWHGAADLWRVGTLAVAAVGGLLAGVGVRMGRDAWVWHRRSRWLAAQAAPGSDAAPAPTAGSRRPIGTAGSAAVTADRRRTDGGYR